MFKNILIFRTDRIGDLIYSCPAIVTLKKSIKNSKVTLISSSKNYEYAKSLNLFDEIYVYPSKNFFKKISFIFFLAKKKFDHILILDGKDRSLVAAVFIKSKNKIIISKYKYFKLLKYLKINVVFNNNKDTFLSLFNSALRMCGLNTNVSNFDFLTYKNDNNFSKNIGIKNYIHIHIDEKWSVNLYIKNYTDIKLCYNEFVSFLEHLVAHNNILITTGIIEYDLINDLKEKYFDKILNNIYKKKIGNNSIYLIYMPSFEDLESLLRSSKIFVSCHCAVTHAANSFGIKIIDIIEEEKKLWYKRWTSYLKNYIPIYRNKFEIIKPLLIKEIIDR